MCIVKDTKKNKLEGNDSDVISSSKKIEISDITLDRELSSINISI